MPRKARSGWGSNQPARRKGYRYLRFTADIGDGRGWTRHRVTFHGTKREGDEELRRLWKRYVDDAGPRRKRSRPQPTFGECWERWYYPEIASRRESGELSASAVKGYEIEWRLRIGPRWKDTRMADVEPSEWQEWLLGLGHNQARMSNIVAGCMVKCAAFHGAEGIRFKTVGYRIQRESREREAPYSLSEVEDIVGRLRGTALEVPAMLCGLASCRVGEACGPLLSDFKVIEARGTSVAVVRIDKQLKIRGRETERTKTEQSVRPVVIGEPWSARLEEIAREKRETGLTYLNDDGCGYPCTRSLVSEQWRDAFKDGGALQGVRYLPMQKLRNSWATFMLWELGVDKWKVDKMMGHAAKDVLGKHYDRPDEILFAETVAEALCRRKKGTLKDI